MIEAHTLSEQAKVLVQFMLIYISVSAAPLMALSLRGVFMRALLASVLIIISGICYAQGFDTADRSLLDASSTPEFLPVEQAYQLDIEIRIFFVKLWQARRKPERAETCCGRDT